MFSAHKLLRLEKMFAGGPHPALQLDRMGREIREPAVRRVDSIKENLFHLYVSILHELYLVFNRHYVNSKNESFSDQR